MKPHQRVATRYMKAKSFAKKYRNEGDVIVIDSTPYL